MFHTCIVVYVFWKAFQIIVAINDSKYWNEFRLFDLNSPEAKSLVQTGNFCHHKKKIQINNKNLFMITHFKGYKNCYKYLRNN